MSPRAACRLEEFGFEEVYDYVLGKADWKGAGLPLDGIRLELQTIAHAMRPDVPTCDPGETIGEVGKRVKEAGWEDCVVVDCDGLVVGRLRSTSWDVDPSLAAGAVMQAGPTTVRPDQALDKLVRRMDRRPTSLIVVATPQGAFLGVVVREDAHRVLHGESPEMIWADCIGCPGQWRPVAEPVPELEG